MELIISSSLTSISSYAFNGCSSLSSLVFEADSSLTLIDDYAFRLSCSNCNLRVLKWLIEDVYEDIRQDEDRLLKFVKKRKYLPNL